MATVAESILRVVCNVARHSCGSLVFHDIVWSGDDRVTVITMIRGHSVVKEDITVNLA